MKEQGQGYFNQRRARFQILERYRGTLPAAGGEVSIFTGPASLCGYPFKVGREYVVYAVRQDDGRMTTGICSRTGPLERAAADLTYARQIAAGHTPRGRIVGEVRHAIPQAPRWKPMPGFPVAVTRDGARFTAVTDARGRYTIEPLEAGSYTFDIPLPETEYSLQTGEAIDLPDPRACVEGNIDILFNGRVSGRVTDSAGRAVAGLTVSYAASQDTERARPLDRRRTLTRDDGRFEIERVPPGMFVVAIELPAGHHDGSSLAEQAAIEMRATLTGGQRLTLDALVLPPEVWVVSLFGIVHGSDGIPAAGARVFVKSGGDAGHVLGAPATADLMGRFLIAVLDGESYMVFAEREIPGTPAASEFSDPVTINATPGLLPLRLTVRRRF